MAHSIVGRFLAPLAFLVAVATSLSGHAEGADDCDEPTNLEQKQCLSQKIDAEQAALDGVYRAALAAMPEADETDNRKSRGQLVTAQAAWKTYVEANCVYVGGQEGGSNSSVTIYGEMCLVDEYQKRIDFLRSQLAP